mmetsp:Transcript_12381/g.22181  ORF Transcript_12381/g.22181 Transcript_12381/m.22181 type:complete len:548 (-) Transcript_12381:290-1933(-)|eukprot:CAMPEP_0178737768 /NCGR_PEP_ID=MMETSP0744-20121128/3152_1 /TAXON_ID=913974 /ORGANISM="Nitzschia punctata, Strain CCMP561" /LENGTH=547 /DNA_ID=CAMNT_0020390335 /DNA_START=179 /DNA_END=1822 /DNA_ORIENTATION=-
MTTQQQQQQEQHEENFRNTRVLIVGFGLSGIVQTHTFVSNGFEDVTVVESDDTFGGVWNLSKHYPGLVTNNTGNTFQFPEMKCEADAYDDWPSQEQVNAYLTKYVSQFDLEKHVQYGTRVQNIRRRLDPTSKDEDKWLFDVTFSRAVKGSLQATYDVVVCATGFTSKPYVPPLFRREEAKDLPQGVRVIHSSEIRKALAEDPCFAMNKRVAVIGTCKSGKDSALWAIRTKAASVDLIGRAMRCTIPYYMHPDPVKNVTEFEMIFSRLLSYLLPTKPAAMKERTGLFRTPMLLYFFHETFLGRAIRDFVWRMRLAEFAKILDIPPHLVSKKIFAQDGRYVSPSDPRFYSYIQEGLINVILEHPIGFDNTHDNPALLLQNPETGRQQEKTYDLIICATGWESSLGFLSEEIRSKLFNDRGQVQLFRNIYCPSLPQMGFIGFHSTLHNMVDAAISSRWVVEMAKGREGSLYRNNKLLEDHEYMWETIEAGLLFDTQDARNPDGFFTTGWAAHQHFDILVKDMGSSKYYRCVPLFKPMYPSMYKGLMTEKL